MYTPRCPAGLPAELVAFRRAWSGGRFALPGSHELNFARQHPGRRTDSFGGRCSCTLWRRTMGGGE
eukprot:12596654-Alexandrium_andersonii.AAC.1